MQILDSISAMRRQSAAWHKAGQRIALVPTMGALHEGHISLVRIARQLADRVIVSVFVNPTQFGEGEDFEHYPRTMEADCALLEAEAVDVVYAPSVQEMYPEGLKTRISVTELTKRWEGEHRPGHFDGVALVVHKLLQQSRPDLAVFGEKDYQQLRVIERMVLDLDMGIDIIHGPIIREADGLALSSRNRYLDESQRAIAAQLHASLQEAARSLREGVAAPGVLDAAQARLIAAGFDAVDYLVLVDEQTLEPLDAYNGTGRLLATARLGTTRLLDNIAVEEA